MSTPNSPFNPSRQVEKIRKILVGREMASVERRLNRLEQHRAPIPVNGRSQPAPVNEAISTGEARLPFERLERELHRESDQRRRSAAAMAEHIHESLEHLKEQIDARPSAAEFDERIGSLRTELRRDLARLESALQENSRSGAESIADLAARVTRLAEQREIRNRDAASARIESSLENWQRQTSEHLKSRERWLIDQLRDELQRLRSETWHWLGELHRTKVSHSEFETRCPRENSRPQPPAPWRRPPESAVSEGGTQKPPS